MSQSRRRRARGGVGRRRTRAPPLSIHLAPPPQGATTANYYVDRAAAVPSRRRGGRKRNRDQFDDDDFDDDFDDFADARPPSPVRPPSNPAPPRPLVLFSFLCSHHVDGSEVDEDDALWATWDLKAALTQTGLSSAFLDSELRGPWPTRRRRSWHWDLYVPWDAAAVLDPVNGHCWSATVDGRRYWGHEERY